MTLDYTKIDQEIRQLIDEQGRDFAILQLFQAAKEAEKLLQNIRRLAIALMSGDSELKGGLQDG